MWHRVGRHRPSNPRLESCQPGPCPDGKHGGGKVAHVMDYLARSCRALQRGVDFCGRYLGHLGGLGGLGGTGNGEEVYACGAHGPRMGGEV